MVRSVAEANLRGRESTSTPVLLAWTGQVNYLLRMALSRCVEEVAGHISALAPEHEVPGTGWYNRFARHPYYGELGECGTQTTRLSDYIWLKQL